MFNVMILLLTHFTKLIQESLLISNILASKLVHRIQKDTVSSFQNSAPAAVG